MSYLRYVLALSAREQHIISIWHLGHRKGLYQLVIVSPELLLNNGRWDQLWTKKKFTDNIICVAMDEAHVIKEWAALFAPITLSLVPFAICGRE